MFKFSLPKATNILFTMLITCLTLSFTLLPVRAYAQDFYQTRSVNAGFYLRIPFGPTKKNEDRLKYGLRLNMSQEFSNSSGWRNDFRLDNRQYINMDLMSLNFSESGFQDMSFAGQKTFIYQNGILRAADDEGKEGGTSPIVWGLAIVGVSVLALGAAYAVALNNEYND